MFVWLVSPRTSIELVPFPLPSCRGACLQVGDDAPLNYTFTISKFDCPSNCSAHGACVTASSAPLRKECRCEEGYAGKDCSQASRALEYGHPVQQEAVAFEIHYFALPTPTGKRAQTSAGRHVLVVICPSVHL
jgi:hypothetical protein